MSKQRFLLLCVVCCVLTGVTTLGQQAEKNSYDAIIDAVVKNEKQMTESMASLSPLVETYMQHFVRDKELGAVPSSDRYFLTKLTAGDPKRGYSMTGQQGFLKRVTGALVAMYGTTYDRIGLVDMILIDDAEFTRQKYDFRYVKKEFLGDVRCLVFDVQVNSKYKEDGFSGRIWVEDEGYHIVRFNGLKGHSDWSRIYFHADSWRQQMAGQWLPSYVYSEESDSSTLGAAKLGFRAQTRLWGYSLDRPQYEDERTSLIVDSETIQDGADADAANSPVLGLRAWERQAEDNVLDRMQKAGLLAPESDVDAVLKTVANNLEITNDLNFTPPLRARVLLTSPIESFTIGHTIIVSRGLIDVLPDEASLAMVIAHEVAHIALEHRLDTRYAFQDRMLFKDYETFSKLIVRRTEAEEKAADAKAVELLAKSPYKDQLGNAGLFLKALQERAKSLPNLLQAHMGNRMASGNMIRMTSLTTSAPELKTNRVDQIAALPLGGRIRVDPWDASVHLVKAKPVALIGPREKMPFEITPLFPYLTRTAPSALANAEK